MKKSIKDTWKWLGGCEENYRNTRIVKKKVYDAWSPSLMSDFRCRAWKLYKKTKKGRKLTNDRSKWSARDAENLRITFTILFYEKDFTEGKVGKFSKNVGGDSQANAISSR